MSKEEAITCIERCDVPGQDTIEVLLKKQRRFPPPSQFQLKAYIKSAAEYRLGTSEIESALLGHGAVAEAAVVGYPHNIKGDGIYAYIVLKEGIDPSDDPRKALINQVGKVIGPIATPDKIQFTSGLPKPRSGKIMRRILRKIATGSREDLGDISTLSDATVVENIVKERL